MLREYIRTRNSYYLTLIFGSIILLFIQVVFSLDKVIIWTIIITSFITMTAVFTTNYISIELNFRKIRKKLKEIDNPELITYYLTRPSHYESGYLYDMLEEISHSLYQKYKHNIDTQLEYQEYLQLFIHDLKLPLQNLKLTTDDQSEITKLEELIDNLLNYSKISLKNVDIKVTNVNLKTVVNNIIKSNFDFILDNNVAITAKLDEMSVTTDKYWISFIVKQLVNNAIKYCEKNILFTITEDEETISILISNDGPLIRQDELNQIFDKGYSGSNSSQKSTGYGLYYAKSIANKLNCHLKVHLEDNRNNFLITFRK